MDFNDIEKAWKNEKTPEMALPSNLDKLASVNMPLDKIRKNLKNELILQAISVGIIGIVFGRMFYTTSVFDMFCLLFLLFLSINAYYLIKIFRFYKRIVNLELKTKDSLYEAYYDIMLNLQLYKSFTYSLVPFMLGFIALIFVNDANGAISKYLNPYNISNARVFWIGLFIGMTASIGFVTEWWVHKFYGKYAKEIRKVLDELKE